jgi:hypothetical protein
MPLPPPSALRTLTHSRRVSFAGYRRADGLWDIEAHLTDVKPHDYWLSSGTRPAGTPVHDMLVRITIDREFKVVAAEAVIDGAPYDALCSSIAPGYGKLVGLNLMHGFRKALRERLGGTLGCSHMSELVAQLPTIAMQTFAGEVRDNEDRGHKPFQLDRCHALETHGEAVRRYYPRWYRAARTGAE